MPIVQSWGRCTQYALRTFRERKGVGRRASERPQKMVSWEKKKMVSWESGPQNYLVRPLALPSRTSGCSVFTLRHSTGFLPMGPTFSHLTQLSISFPSQLIFVFVYLFFKLSNYSKINSIHPPTILSAVINC